MRVPFTKMESCGNDYVFVDGIGVSLPIERGSELAEVWSDRHFGIGGDGLIVMIRGRTLPVRMLMWNADGSRGAMCGNGLRCLARFAYDRGHLREARFAIETDAGTRRVELLPGGQVRTWMGAVQVSAPRWWSVAGRQVELVAGDAGNPHVVTFVDDVEAAPIAPIGVELQSHGDFPGGVNVSFVQILGSDRLRQRTYERGSGETLACGTGAAVAVAAARSTARIGAAAVSVELRGGTLLVEGEGSSLAIVGPTRTVFTGEIELPT